MPFFDELRKWLQEFAVHYVPSVSLDLVILGFHGGELKVLLLRPKATNEWCLPGGRIRKDEDLQTAADRTLRDRTGLDKLFLQQFHTFGEVNRLGQFSEEVRHRAGWSELFSSLSSEEIGFLTGRTLSVGFFALVDYTQVNPTLDFASEECRWWTIPEVPALIMDHHEMIRMALKSLRRQLSYQPIGYNLLPEKFTMTELQSLYETILGRSLDRRNFYKQMMAYGMLERLERRPTVPSSKAPYLYRFIKARYEELLNAEDLYRG